VLFVLGAATALVGSLAMLVQNDVKRALGWSTVGQMGFMVMQCGLGFFAAAMAHLVLHGLYKAAQFLGAGSAITKGNRPGKAEAPAPTALTALGAVLAFAAAAGVFGTVTGKLAWDTGLILVLFAGFAGAQAVVGFRGEITPVRMVAVPGVVAVAALLYGGVVRLAELVLAPVPGLTAPQPLSWFHLVLTGVVAVVWLAVLAGAHRRSAAFYVRMLALFQPAPSTITAARETANA
jgi:NAD(P)H-quinone oxidoreductase subunit 5